MRADGTTEEAAIPPTVLLSPAEANLTLPPQPTLREGATTLVPVPPPRRRPGVPATWVLGAAATAALALAVVAWALWPRSRSGRAEEAGVAASLVASPAAAASPASTPPPPPLGTLLVESEPAGARVSVNDEMEGETPLRLSDLPFGVYEVRVERKGYEPQERDVSLSAGAAAGELRFVLARPPAPPQGEADVVSTPSGAAVSVDGRPVGTTPLTGLRLRPGRRRLEVALDGHETWTQTVDVAAGGTGRVEVRLTPLPRPADAPTPEPVDVTRVYENTAGDVDTLARKLSGSSPSYPTDRARRLKSGERVSVVVRFVVTEGGEVQEVSVLESGGKPLDDVVVAAIRGWKFQPATKRGTRVKVHVTFKQTFLGG
jgi:TonB family protein